MRLAYIVPATNDAGGVARVLAIKSDYFIRQFGHQIHFITQNQSCGESFFDFNPNCVFHDIKRKGNKFLNYLFYFKNLKKILSAIEPDCILVCDFGYKGFLVPFFIKTKVPIIFEAHGSIYNESRLLPNNVVIRLGKKLKYIFRKNCVKNFDAFVALSQESLGEWNIQNGFVIPNPNWIKADNISIFDSKIVVAIARHSHEKGLDRLLKIWKKIVQTHPDWKLEIYGEKLPESPLSQLVDDLRLQESVIFFDPLQDIAAIYQNASIIVMTSRSEGFPMVLVEAMAFGLPVIAYDCPIGPRVLIQNEVNGFLIEDNNEDKFVIKLGSLMNDKSLRTHLGQNAKISVQKYDVEKIMTKWQKFIFDLAK